MAKAAAHFDAQTIALLKVALDEAWDRLPPKLQATMLKATLAERILKSAATGERNRERLREAALRDLPRSGNKKAPPRISSTGERPLMPRLEVAAPLYGCNRRTTWGGSNYLREHVMKLSSEKLGSILEQIDAEVIPDNHPSLPKLREVFGDHTFFVDDGGLTIIQPLDQHRQTGGLVKIARWDDADPPHLVAHTPEETDILIRLESAH